MDIIFAAIALLLGLVVWSAPGRDGLGAQIRPIVGANAFSLAAWEVRTLAAETIPSVLRRHDRQGDASAVLAYFAAGDEIRALQSRLDALRESDRGEATALEDELNSLRRQRQSLAGTAEEVLERQIRAVAAEQGIYNPLTGLRFSFPPVEFKLARPPNLLVVSPRGAIESEYETMLRPELTVAQMEEIEGRVDRLGVSSLVTGIGGLGVTYPTFVADDMSLRQTIDAATEEWLHQYLVFRPLGFLYLLDVTGAAPNYEIARMNETLASLVSKEIGGIVFDRYYGSRPRPEAGETPDVDTVVLPDEETPAAPPVDFNHEMRQIRKTVDRLLAEGRVEAAEDYMEDRRQYLATNGYYIRKLNQAYFAFYGTYTDSPSSIDPIGSEMRQLRSDSASLKAFLARVSGMTSRQALEEAAPGAAAAGG